MSKQDGSEDSPIRILRKGEVVKRVGVSDTTLWRLERRGQFPKHIQISARAVGWAEADVDAWITAKKRA